MELQLFVQLIAQVGLPLAVQIRQWYVEGRASTTVTDADLLTITVLGQYRSPDALTAAGIKIVDGKVVTAT